MKVEQIIYGLGCLVTATGLTSAIYFTLFLDAIFGGAYSAPIGALTAQCEVIEAIPAGDRGAAQFPYFVSVTTESKRRETVEQRARAAILGDKMPEVAFRSDVGRKMPCWWDPNQKSVFIIATEVVETGVNHLWFYAGCIVCCTPCCFLLGCYMLYAGVTEHQSAFMSSWRCDTNHPHAKGGPRPV